MTTAAPEAPPVVAPTPTPAATAAPAAAATQTPAPTPAPAATPEPARVEPSLLGGAKAEPKPGETPVAVPAVPEQYTDFKLPEGVTLDKELLEKATPVFKELGLSQDAAQKLVTLQAESSKAGMEAVVKAAEAQKTAFLETEKQATLKALGPDHQKELAFAAKALDWAEKVAPGFRALLDQTGFGMNLNMAKVFIALGKTFAEDEAPGPRGSEPQNSEEAQLRTMFPSMYNEDGSRKT